MKTLKLFNESGVTAVITEGHTHPAPTNHEDLISCELFMPQFGWKVKGEVGLFQPDDKHESM